MVTDIGFPEMVTERVMKQSQTFTYTKEDISVYFPNRKKRSNKGSYGRVVVIAGSKDMSGACYLSGEAAYRMGCGLVHIVTAQENAEVIRIKLPEAIVTGWSENVTAEQEADITAAIHKAAAVVIGPGLGQEAGAERLLDLVLQEAKKLPELPVVIDADGLNLLAKKAIVFYTWRTVCSDSTFAGNESFIREECSGDCGRYDIGSYGTAGGSDNCAQRCENTGQ